MTLLVLLAGFPVPSPAATTRVFEVLTGVEIPRGTYDQVVYSSRGELSLGPQRTTSGLPEKEIWDAVLSKSGPVWFVTGNGAALYRLPPPTRQDKVLLAGTPERVFGAAEIALTCLVEAPSGKLYAGSLPSGRIYEFEPDGTGRIMATLPAPYVWSLAWGPDEALYAGCGPEGVIYRVDPARDGRVEAWFDTRDTNVMALLVEPGGSMLAATAGRGLLFRITEPGKARVILDLEGREVKALAQRTDQIYLAVNQPSSKPAPAPGATSGKAMEFSEIGRKLAGKYDGLEFIQPPSGGDEDGEPRAGISSYQGGHGAQVIALSPDGRHEILHTLPHGYLMDLALDGQGRLYLALGGEGQVMMLEGPGVWSLVYADAGSMVSCLATSPEGLTFAGISNPGAFLQALPQQRAPTGSFVASVQDAGSSSRWGNVESLVQGNLSFQSRSGNTLRPDHTWSDWLEVGPGMPGRIQSPAGRYLQLRLQWADDGGAAVRSLKAYYLNENQRPLIEDFAVGDAAAGAGADPAKPGNEPGSGGLKALRRLVKSGGKDAPDKDRDSGKATDGESAEDPDETRPTGSVVLSWTARDGDGDRLAFRLWYRPMPGSPWLPITPRDPITRNRHTWDTASVPDGLHTLKLEASDELSNPPGEHLTAQRELGPILVDNTRPKVVGLKLERETWTLSGTARDEMTAIRKLEYQVDGGDWKVFAPRDRLLDAIVEDFDLKLPALGPGAHVVGVRAVDRAGNTGVALLVIHPAP